MVLAPQTSSLPKLMLKPGRWTVGSAATCSYRIIGDGVCPRHALVLCGRQSAVLKAWDSRTWHNGEQVRGEVRLQQGDRVTLGSVEFSVEPEDMLEAETLSPEVRHETSTRSAEINSAVSHSAKPDPEGWDLERLRDQIQELRDELSQRANRRIGAVAPATIPTPASEDAVKQAVKQAVEEAVNQTSARIAELERSAAEAQVIAEQVRQQHAAALADQTRREAELQQVIATLQFEATELRSTKERVPIRLRFVDAFLSDQMTPDELLNRTVLELVNGPQVGPSSIRHRATPFRPTARQPSRLRLVRSAG